jgi:hypothetical protein
MKNPKLKLEIFAMVLVILMTLLQGFYGLFAFVDPTNFAHLRGTELYSKTDADWVVIYGSRTLFITLILGSLLYFRHYSILMWCALFGMIMPVTDGLLAYHAGAPFKVVFKHGATVLYLAFTYVILMKTVKSTNTESSKRQGTLT